MNTGKRYIGYGKALFPPHPEDLLGAGNCCMMPPCLTKPPC